MALQAYMHTSREPVVRMWGVAALRIRHGSWRSAPMTPFVSSSSFGVAKALRQRAGRLVPRTTPDLSPGCEPAESRVVKGK